MGNGMKDRYLMLIFKIVMLASSEVETDPLKTDGQKKAGGHSILNIGIWCNILPTKVG